MKKSSAPTKIPYTKNGMSTQLEVGSGVTFMYGSDCYPGTIVEIMDDRRVVCRADQYRVISGSFHGGNAVVEYEANPDGRLVKVVLKATKKFNGWAGDGFRVDVFGRHFYMDPSF